MTSRIKGTNPARVIAALVATPLVTAAMVAESAQVSRDTAERLLARLASMGLVRGCATPARGLGQPVVAGVAIDLQDAVEAVQEGFGILARATGGVEVEHARRGPRRPKPGRRGPAPRGSRSSSCHAPDPAPGPSSRP